MYLEQVRQFEHRLLSGYDKDGIGWNCRIKLPMLTNTVFSVFDLVLCII